MCLVLCATATATVTSRISPANKASRDGPWFDLHALRDPRFSLLVIGSCFMSLGACGFSSPTFPESESAPSRIRPRADWRADATLPASTGLFTPFCYLVSYATDVGISPGTAFYVLAVLNAASVLGRIAPAHVADALGRFALLVPCAFCAGLSTLLLWPAAHSLVPLVLYAALYGLFSGAFNALIVPCIAQISDIREIGMRIGLLYSIISFP